MSLVESSPALSAVSLRRLSTCDQMLQDIVMEVARTFPLMVICGHRTKEEQDQAVREGKSKSAWPTSKHNSIPSRAVDLAPLKNGTIDWDDRDRFLDLWREMFRVAKDRGVDLRFGGDWNGDGKTRYDGDKTEKLVDLPHYELLGAR